MLKTYDSLLRQISDLIDSQIPELRGVTVASKQQISSLARSESAGLDKAMRIMTDDLGEILGSKIISGLVVTAEKPPSEKVSITAGKGSAQARIYELLADTTVTIPLDSHTYVFYVLLYENQIKILTSKPSTHCVLAKIVVPNPGATARIVDDKPTDGYDGWIVSGKDMFFDQDQEFDDDSREVLKNALNEISAEVIFGTLRASENLSVTNVLGTVVMDSRAIHFYDGDKNELSYYGADFARIGSIKILPDRLKSMNYSSGISGFEIRKDGSVEFRSGIIGGWNIGATTLSALNITIDSSGSIRTNDFISGPLGIGWQIHSNGTAEFQNITARGEFVTSVFKQNTISAVGGNLLVSSASTLEADLGSTTTDILVKDNTFEKNEVLRIKDGTSDEWMLVVDDSNAPAYSVTRDHSNDHITNPLWKAGTAVVSMGKTGAGFISMDSISANSPYIDVYQRSGTTWNDYALKARLGNLNSIAGMNGFGLFSQNVYLTGIINAINGTLHNLDILGTLDLSGGSIRTAETTPRLIFDADGLKYQVAEAGTKYDEFQYGDGTKYGAGITAYVLSPTIKVPFYVRAEQTVADLHLYDRTADPTGKAEIGDLAVVNGALKICTSGGTPGTFEDVGGVGGIQTYIADTDDDTKVQTEESPDEDIIRFDTGGTERAHLDATSLDLAVDVDFNDKEALAMRIENRTSDPAGSAGYIWFRTDV